MWNVQIWLVWLFRHFASFTIFPQHTFLPLQWYNFKRAKHFDRSQSSMYLLTCYCPHGVFPVTSQYTRTSRLKKPISLVGFIAISRKLIVLCAHFRCSRQFDYDIDLWVECDRFYNTVIFEISDVYMIYIICHHISHYCIISIII